MIFFMVQRFIFGAPVITIRKRGNHTKKSATHKAVAEER